LDVLKLGEEIRQVILYTVQHIDAYYVLRKNGILTGNPKRSFLPESYEWMRKQMNLRIAEPSDTYPIWLWTHKPNRNQPALLRKGVRGVILTVDVPEKQVLLSDFDAWHVVLNNQVLELYDGEEIDKETSWERIFNLDLILHHPYYHNGDEGSQWVQAVTPYIKYSQIQRVERFIAK